MALALALPASAQASNGAISGRITDTSNGGLQGAYAVLFSYSDATGNSPVANAFADQFGNYTLSNVPPNDYKVCFYPAQGDNYVGECYNDTQDYSTAAKVTVASGTTTPNISGALSSGGKISGQITDALTLAPLNYALAEAFDASGNIASVGQADSSGFYTIAGLPTQSFTVCFGFSPDEPAHLTYHSQCYNGKPFNKTGGDPVSVTVGQTTPNINAALVPHYVVTVSRTGSGSVTSSPAGINCGAVCTHDFDGGTPVTLTATPAAGYRFGGWSGRCTGTGACQFSVTATTTVTATFVKKPVPRPGKPSITDSNLNARHHKASFKFNGAGASKGFQCALIKPHKKGQKPKSPKFSGCKSPKRYTKLASGKYTFEVRGVSAGGAGAAAKVGFSI
jgi:hypothetical protein